MEPVEHRFEVEGMRCGGCEGSVRRALEALEGVTEVSADHRRGEVKVVARAGVSPSALRGAIEGAGFSVQRQERS
jgi:copper chaperone CopZ